MASPGTQWPVLRVDLVLLFFWKAGVKDNRLDYLILKHLKARPHSSFPFLSAFVYPLWSGNSPGRGGEGGGGRTVQASADIGLSAPANPVFSPSSSISADEHGECRGQVFTPLSGDSFPQLCSVQGGRLHHPACGNTKVAFRFCTRHTIPSRRAGGNLNIYSKVTVIVPKCVFKFLSEQAKGAQPCMLCSSLRRLFITGCL